MVEEAVRRRERQESMAGREEMSRKLDRFLSLYLYSSSYLAMSLYLTGRQLRTGPTRSYSRRG